MTWKSFSVVEHVFRVGQNGLHSNLLFHVKVENCYIMCTLGHSVENSLCTSGFHQGHNGHWVVATVSTWTHPKLKIYLDITLKGSVKLWTQFYYPGDGLHSEIHLSQVMKFLGSVRESQREVDDNKKSYISLQHFISLFEVKSHNNYTPMRHLIDKNVSLLKLAKVEEKTKAS